MSAPWTPQEDAELAAAGGGRWPITRMMARLRGRSRSAIVERARRLGVELAL